MPNAMLMELVPLVGDDDRMFNSVSLLEILKTLERLLSPAVEPSLLLPPDVNPPF